MKDYFYLNNNISRNVETGIAIYNLIKKIIKIQQYKNRVGTITESSQRSEGQLKQDHQKVQQPMDIANNKRFLSILNSIQKYENEFIKSTNDIFEQSDIIGINALEIELVLENGNKITDGHVIALSKYYSALINAINCFDDICNNFLNELSIYENRNLSNLSLHMQLVCRDIIILYDTILYRFIKDSNEALDIDRLRKNTYVLSALTEQYSFTSS